eukprot:Em0010g130a
MTDFQFIEIVDFPSAGSDNTPAHKFPDFTFKTYSPVGFRFFREAFGIKAEDFLVAMCDRPLIELSNSGASGSLFFLSADDAFIMKTVQKKEAKFLQKLLPGYYMNLTQNKRTLLPKFFGLYRYKSGSVNIRVAVMNNLLPSSIKYHEKYDLKGSTYKRKASPHELIKSHPTFKDLDFRERHDDGIALAAENYEILMRTMDRDCRVLESFSIMDFSLLIGLHYIDHGLREQFEAGVSPSEMHAEGAAAIGGATAGADVLPKIDLNKNYSVISGEEIPIIPVEDGEDQPTTTQATPNTTSLAYYPEGYIQGKVKGERVILYLGIIDILQSYRFRKKVEHTVKSIIADGATVSVTNPSFYVRRFLEFTTNLVFKKEKGRTKTRRNSQKTRKTVPVGNKGVKLVALTTQQSQDDPQDSLNLFQNSISLPQSSELTDSLVIESGSLFNKRTSREDPPRHGYLPEIQLVKVRTTATTHDSSPSGVRSLIVEHRSGSGATDSPGAGAVGVKSVTVRSEPSASGADAVGVKSATVENRSEPSASGADAVGVKSATVENRSEPDAVARVGKTVSPGPLVEEKDNVLQQASAGGLPAAHQEVSGGGEVEFEVNVHNTSTPTDSRQNLKIEPTEEAGGGTVVTASDSSVVEEVQEPNSSSLVSDII